MILHLSRRIGLCGIKLTRIPLGEAMTSRMSLRGPDLCINVALYPTYLCMGLFYDGTICSQGCVLRRAGHTESGSGLRPCLTC